MGHGRRSCRTSSEFDRLGRRATAIGSPGVAAVAFGVLARKSFGSIVHIAGDAAQLSGAQRAVFAAAQMGGDGPVARSQNGGGAAGRSSAG